MNKYCTICNRKYWAKQERSLYCSNACKQHAHRIKVANTVLVTQKENVTLKDMLIKRLDVGEDAICCYCGKSYKFEDQYAVSNDKRDGWYVWWCPECNKRDI